ncbi:MAG: right-handed parallel beta-helix repeat-containing protein [Planctomycetota bacterium]
MNIDRAALQSASADVERSRRALDASVNRLLLAAQPGSAPEPDPQPDPTPQPEQPAFRPSLLGTEQIQTGTNRYQRLRTADLDDADNIIFDGFGNPDMPHGISQANSNIDTATKVVVRNSYLQGRGSDYINPIALQQREGQLPVSLRIEDSIVVDPSHNGVYMMNSHPSASGTIELYGSAFVDSTYRQGNVRRDHHGYYDGSHKRAVVRDCVFIGGSASSLKFLDTEQIIVENCVFVDSGYGVEVGDSGRDNDGTGFRKSDVTFGNCLFYNMTDREQQHWGFGVYLRWADALFENCHIANPVDTLGFDDQPVFVETWGGRTTTLNGELNVYGYGNRDVRIKAGRGGRVENNLRVNRLPALPQITDTDLDGAASLLLRRDWKAADYQEWIAERLGVTL